jgi:hypothetical protein
MLFQASEYHQKSRETQLESIFPQEKTSHVPDIRYVNRDKPLAGTLPKLWCEPWPLLGPRDSRPPPMPIFPPHADDVAHFTSAFEPNSHNPHFQVLSTLATRLTGSQRGYGKVVAILKGPEEKRKCLYIR